MLQEGNVIQEAYNFNLPLRVIQMAYSGKWHVSGRAYEDGKAFGLAPFHIKEVSVLRAYWADMP